MRQFSATGGCSKAKGPLFSHGICNRGRLLNRPYHGLDIRCPMGLWQLEHLILPSLIDDETAYSFGSDVSMAIKTKVGSRSFRKFFPDIAEWMEWQSTQETSIVLCLLKFQNGISLVTSWHARHLEFLAHASVFLPKTSSRRPFLPFFNMLSTRAWHDSQPSLLTGFPVLPFCRGWILQTCCIGLHGNPCRIRTNEL